MRRFLIVLTLGLLLVASPALASNMGFKLVRTLYPATGGSFGNNYVSNPWFVSYTDAAAVYADLTTLGVTPIILHHITNTAQATAGCGIPVNNNEQYDGGFFSCNFPIAKGEGYIVVIDGVVNKDWVIVGSHDDVASKTVYTATGGSFGNNYISVPYHTNKADAAALYTELTALGVSPIILHHITNAAQATAGCGIPVNNNEQYDGGFFSCNFAIRAGEAYIIVIDGVVDKLWQPAHY